MGKILECFPVAAWPPKARGFGGPRALDQISWDGSHLSSSACGCELLASGRTEDCDPDLFEAEPPVPTLRFAGVICRRNVAGKASGGPEGTEK